MRDLQIHQIPCLSDNYAVLVHDPQSGATALFDAPDATPIRAALNEHGWTLSHIFITHHHLDHTQAIAPLKAATGCRVIVPAAEAAKIADADEGVADGDSVPFGTTRVEVIGAPGHTLGQVTYWIPKVHVAFTGDTLFAMGCGRVFEGTSEMMWSTLDRLATVLPDETQIYCGHEYTLANAKFALTIDPVNPLLRERLEEVERLRQIGRATLPTTMADEKETNPFLRARDPAIKDRLGLSDADPAAVFAEIRARKDNF